MENSYPDECRRILNEYHDQIAKVFDYEYCELDSSFLGFLDVYNSVKLPEDFIIIDLGCYQAVQALYFENCAQYIGVDCALPCDMRFPQDNALYYNDTIQHFIEETLPRLIEQGLDLNKTFAFCSYVPDKEAQKLTAKVFPFHKVQYCEKILSERLPFVINREKDVNYRELT